MWPISNTMAQFDHKTKQILTMFDSVFSVKMKFCSWGIGLSQASDGRREGYERNLYGADMRVIDDAGCRAYYHCQLRTACHHVDRHSQLSDLPCIQ